MITERFISRMRLTNANEPHTLRAFRAVQSLSLSLSRFSRHSLQASQVYVYAVPKTAVLSQFSFRVRSLPIARTARKLKCIPMRFSMACGPRTFNPLFLIILYALSCRPIYYTKKNEEDNNVFILQLTNRASWVYM